MGKLQQTIENSWSNRGFLKNEELNRSIRKVIDLLDNDIAA